MGTLGGFDQWSNQWWTHGHLDLMPQDRGPAAIRVMPAAAAAAAAAAARAAGHHAPAGRARAAARPRSFGRRRASSQAGRPVFQSTSPAAARKIDSDEKGLG
jgi:hypothetical protein